MMKSVMELNNNIKGRYIKLSIKSLGNNTSYIITGSYLEPKGSKLKIPEELFDSDIIIIGGLNKIDSILNRYDIYHYKNIKIQSKFKIKNKISELNVLLGEV